MSLISLINVMHLMTEVESESDVWPNMVFHTLNVCFAFNPSKCTHTVVNTHIHLEQ